MSLRPSPYVPMKHAVITLFVAWMLASTVAAQPRSRYQQAATAYEAAISRYGASKWAEAAELLETFVKGHASSEKVPDAYILLAHCRWQLKEQDKCEAAADEVIKRFYPSRCALWAYGTKLGLLQQQQQPDKYLDNVEIMVRRLGFVPTRLPSVIRHGGGTGYQPWPWNPWTPNAVPFGDDFSVDMLKVCDTPERAGRALKLLEKLFNGKADDVPADWQHAHVCLIQQGGDAAAAEKQFKSYLDGWGKDPRAVELGLRRAAHLRSLKDVKAEDSVWEILRKDFAGYGNLQEPLRLRTLDLLSTRRTAEFLVSARDYVSLGWDGGNSWQGVLSAWFEFGIAAAAKGDQAELKNVLAYMDGLDQKTFPRLPNAGLNMRLRAALTLKDDAAATKYAEELVSDRQWCAENFGAIVPAAASSQAVAKVVAAARAKRGVPEPDPSSKAAGMLKDVQARLKTEQPRFAEEIAQEMFDKHRADDATIAAAAAMADFYFNKVLAEPRDKWMNRMVEAYPQHPRTQATLANQIGAERGQRAYNRVAALCETGTRLFPGAAWHYFNARIEAFSAAQDLKGAAEYARTQLGERAKTDPGALLTLQMYMSQAGMADAKTRGDQWMEIARRLAGTRGELICLIHACNAYSPGPVNNTFEQAKPPARVLRTQTMDGRVRWGYEFLECHLLMGQGQSQAAAQLAMEILGEQTNIRDLYGRLSYGPLASGLGRQGKLDEAAAITKKIRQACPSLQDQMAADWFEGSALHYAGSPLPAAKKYAEVLDKHPYPALIFPLVGTVQAQLGGTPEGHAFSQKWVKEFDSAQDCVPPILFKQGMAYFSQKQTAGLSRIRRMLSDKYSASFERDELEKRVGPPPKAPGPGH